MLTRTQKVSIYMAAVLEGQGKRPRGYMAALQLLAVHDPTRVTADGDVLLTLAEYTTLRTTPASNPPVAKAETPAQSAGNPPPVSVEKVATFMRAVLTGKRVDKDLQAEREATCARCELRRQNDKGVPYCGVCGCNVGEAMWRIFNLTTYVENLPDWGCKHPERIKGKGWRR